MKPNRQRAILLIEADYGGEYSGVYGGIYQGFGGVGGDSLGPEDTEAGSLPIGLLSSQRRKSIRHPNDDQEVLRLVMNFLDTQG